MYNKPYNIKHLKVDVLRLNFLNSLFYLSSNICYMFPNVLYQEIYILRRKNRKFLFNEMDTKFGT